ITAFSPDGTRVAVAYRVESGVLSFLYGSFFVDLWDIETAKKLRGTHLGPVGKAGSEIASSLAYAPDGTRFVSGGFQSLKLWDGRTGEPIRTIPAGHKGWIRSVAFSPDGRRILSGGEDGTIREWDAETGAQLRSCEAGAGMVAAVGFTPDGRRFVSAGPPGLKLWERGNRRFLATPIRPPPGAASASP